MDIFTNFKGLILVIMTWMREVNNHLKIEMDKKRRFLHPISSLLLLTYLSFYHSPTTSSHILIHEL